MLVVWSSENVGLLVQKLGLQGVAVGTGSNPPNPGEAKVLLCMGTRPLNKLVELGVLPKNRTIGSLRNKPFDALIWGQKVTVFVTYSPSILNRDYGCYIDMLCDLRFIHRFAVTGKMYPERGNYRYVPDFSEAVAAIKAKAAKGYKVEVTCDLETLGLDPYFLGGKKHAGKGTKIVECPEAHIVTIQITHEVGMADVVYFNSKGEQDEWYKKHGKDLLWILNSKDVTTSGANFKYDLHWMWVHFKLECSNFKFDTTLVGNMLDENRSNGLEVHTKIYAPEMGGYSDTFDSTIDKSRMDLVDPKLLLNYGGGDTDATLRVKLAMKKELLKPENKEMARFYVNILHPSARAFEKVERGGVFVDIDKFNELERDLKVSIHESVEHAKNVLGGRILAKHHDAGKEFGINLTKASLIQDFMFSPMGLNLKPRMFTEKGSVTTSMEHIELFSDVEEAKPFIEAMKAYQSASKTLSTYVVGFRKHLRSDNRMHPTYWFFSGDKARGDGGTACMPLGELVLTDRGYLTVEDVRKGDKVISHTGSVREVTDLIYNGVHPIYTVILADGRTLRTTGNHPYYIEGKWVRADCLKEGMLATTYGGVEEWRVIPEWEDYEVSSWGRVRHSETKKVRKLRHKGKWGHLKVTLSRNGSQKRGVDKVDYPVHRLVLRVFKGIPDGCEVRHLNGLAWDNNLTNLTAGTSAENSADASKHGTISKRESREAKLSEAVVAEIRSLPLGTKGSPHTNKALAEKYGVCTRLIRAVRNGYRWEKKEHSRVLDFGTSPIVSIEISAPKHTLGLTVDTDHSHVTGGIVTHNTGRLSARDPAFQTVPKHTYWGKRIRSCYAAPEGHLVGEFDYSQGELKVVACVANEANMIEAYAQGKDLHALTASGMLGLTYEQMMELKDSDPETYGTYRQYGKPCNFGLLYGMSANGLREYARISYGVVFSEKQANDFREAFFNTYPMLPVYHEEYKRRAKRQGYVSSPMGRRRHLPLINSGFGDVRSGAERQAVNAPIQAALSDMLCWAIAIGNERGFLDYCPSFGAIHDATYNYIPEDRVDECVAMQLEIMENLPFHKVGWNPQLKFTADAKIGPSMGELKDYA